MRSRTKQTRKEKAGITRQCSEVMRPSADCQTTYLRRFKQLGNFLKKSLNGHATLVTVTRPSADCQTTFFGRFKLFGIFLKKVTERSRDSGRRSRDRRLTVKHIYVWIRERGRESISVTFHTGTAMLCRWPFHQPASQLKLALAGVKVSPAYTGRRSAGTASLWIL